MVITGLGTVKEAGRTKVDGTHWTTCQEGTCSYFTVNHQGQGGSMSRDFPLLYKQGTALEMDLE